MGARLRRRRTSVGLLLPLVVVLLVPSGGQGQQVTPQCAYETATIVGTSRGEEIRGTPDADVIHGLGGNDTIEGLGGADSLCGGTGNDTLLGGPADDWMSGDAGDDELDGGAGIDDVAFYDFAPGRIVADLRTGQITGWGTDTVTATEDVGGSRFADRITGDAQVNVLWGWRGNDRIFGGGNDDWLSGEAGLDRLHGDAGSDTVYYDFSPRRVVVNLAGRVATGWGRDRLVSIENADGSRFADVLIGNGGPNWLSGWLGSDRIFGRAGADRLDGGRGRDRLDGGAGRDVCLRGEIKRSCP